MTLLPSRVLSQPATVQACAQDYQQHHTPETQAASREQSGQARTDGNAAAGTWHGHQQRH